MGTELTRIDGQTSAMSMKQITDRVNLVHEVLQKVMKKGTHYGTVPGCGEKKVLFKPGADLLAMAFRLVPRFNVVTTDLANGHREFSVECSMFTPAGELLGMGVGSGSTMEKKYRYRKDGNGRIENEDIADCYNTVLKMAKKRAHVDATLTVTGAADIFTQDIIDDEDGKEPRKGVPMPEPKAAKPEGDTVIGQVEDVQEHAPTGAAKNTRYGIKVEGVIYGTFDKAHADLAKDAQTQGKPVQLAWLKKGAFLNVASIVIFEEQPPE